MTATLSMSAARMTNAQHIEMTEHYAAHNYHPLPVVIARGEGVWVEDADGKRYMDMLAGYSAINFGHSNRELIDAARAQLDLVTLTSRAFFNDRLGPFCRDLAALCKKDAILPMNSGAEGVETAIKTARKWAYVKKGVPDGRANIVVGGENFHGRTTTIISFSTDEQTRAHFGPLTPGFKIVPFGDAGAVEAAIDEHTAAVMVEPIQGEAGIIIPPDGYLKRIREVCTTHKVLFVADEIQAGLGRTGTTFACEHEGVTPDMYILGKALGGGIMPVSAVAANWDVLDVFKPGDHGSTFGGNPLACAIGSKVVEMLNRGDFQRNSMELGRYMHERLRAIKSDKIQEIRGRGLWFGVQFKPQAGKARPYCEKLLGLGILCKDTHEQTMRLAPPLCMTRAECDWALERLESVLK